MNKQVNNPPNKKIWFKGFLLGFPNRGRETFSPVIVRNLVLLILTLIIYACNSDDKKPIILAHWEEFEVTSEEFVTQYVLETSTKPIADSFEQRKAFIQSLIEKKIIASIGRSNKLDTLPDVQRRIRFVEEQALRKYYLRTTIEKRISEPTSTQIKHLFEKQNTRLKVEQIYGRSKQEIDSLYRLLKTGRSFESLAISSMKKYGVSRPDSSWKMGWITWNDMDLAPETVVFALSKDEISSPVASLNGWHIFRVTAREKKVFVDGSTFQSQKDNLGFEWKKRRFEELSTRFIDSVLRITPLAVSYQTLAKVRAQVLPFYRTDNPVVNHIALRMKNDDLLHSLDPNEPLAQMKDDIITVGEFIERLPDIPSPIVQRDFREALEFALKDKLFSEKGKNAGIQNHPKAQKEIVMGKENALYFATLRASADTASLERLKKEYYTNLRPFEFTTSVETTSRIWSFADSASAWSTIRKVQQGSSWKKALEDYPLEKNLWIKTSEVNQLHAVHRFRLSTKIDTVIVGPFFEENRWILAEPISRTYHRKKPAEIEEELSLRTERELPQLIHHGLLFDHYNPKDIIYHEQAIVEALSIIFPESFYKN